VLASVISGTGPGYESGPGREIMSSESRHARIRINILGSQLSPSSINSFGTGASWEGNRRSGVALAMRHRQ